MPGVQSPTAEHYEEASHGQRIWDKTKKNPMVPLGLAGMFGTVAYGAYSYRFKGKMSTSVFLMHLRVKAQSVVVGAMTIGVAYTLLKDYFKKDISKK